LRTPPAAEGSFILVAIEISHFCAAMQRCDRQLRIPAREFTTLKGITHFVLQIDLVLRKKYTSILFRESVNLIYSTFF
jgi:hypothetical protein